MRATAPAVCLIVALTSLTASVPAFGDLASSFGVFVYPKNGQSPTQQNADQAACYASAMERTGVNPAAPPPPGAVPPPPPQQGGILRNAAGGALAGTAIGAVTGNAGQGAAVGAIAGGLFGYRQQRLQNQAAQQVAQDQATARYQQGMDAFRRAFSACMTARAYVAQ